MSEARKCPWGMIYDVFGKPYSKQLDGTITKLKKSPIGNTRLYTGREYDRGLKLYYNRARYYDPKLARFISRDPIDIADDVILYAYVGNNSVMFVDLIETEKLSIPLYDNAYALRAYLTYKEVKGNITDIVVEINENINYDLLIDAGKPLKLIGVGSVTVGLSTCVNGSLVTAGAGTVPSCGGGLAVAGGGAIMAATGYGLEEGLGKIGKNSQKGTGGFNSKQDKMLSNGEIKKLKDAGYDIHDLKPSSKFDLFKDNKCNIYYKRKTGRGDSEPVDIQLNIKDF